MKISLDKGVYHFVNCYSQLLGLSIGEGVVELLHLFRFLSGGDEGLEVLKEIVEKKSFNIPSLGKRIEVEVEISGKDLEYLRRVAEILGSTIDEALKTCLATCAKLLRQAFPGVRCRLRGMGYAKYRLMDFKEVVSKKHRETILLGVREKNPAMQFKYSPK